MTHIDPSLIWIQSRFGSYRASHIILQVVTPNYAHNPRKTWYFVQENFDITIIHFFDDLFFSNFPISPFKSKLSSLNDTPCSSCSTNFKITELLIITIHQQKNIKEKTRKMSACLYDKRKQNDIEFLLQTFNILINRKTKPKKFNMLFACVTY